MKKSIAEFLEYYDKKGQVLEIDAPLDTELEICEVTDRFMKSGNSPILKFIHVKGHEMPVVTNLFGTEDRMAGAFGVESLSEISDRIEQLVKFKMPEKITEKFSMLMKLKDMAGFPPKLVKRGKCQEIVWIEDEVNLDKIPILKTWPEDGGPFITLPQVITRDPLTGERNVGMYRLQKMGKNITGMHWQRHKDGAHHYEEARKKGERIEVAVAIGGPPAAIYSASAPLPPGIDEYLFTGFLMQESVELVKCKTIDLEVPAEADIVLEGYVDPNEQLVTEGPFGDHTGFYSLADQYPLYHITAITMRQDAHYPATIVGRPPMEDKWMGYATERIFLPLIRLTLPEVTDYHMPAEGIFHNLVFVSIKKSYPGQAYKVMNGLWGLGQMMFAKTIVVVDDLIDVHQTSDVWWYALNNIDPQRDVMFTKGPADVLDHSSGQFSFGSKMGIDGTRKWPEEGFQREWPPIIGMSDEIKDRIDQLWPQIIKNLK